MVDLVKHYSPRKTIKRIQNYLVQVILDQKRDNQLADTLYDKNES